MRELLGTIFIVVALLFVFGVPDYLCGCYTKSRKRRLANRRDPDEYRSTLGDEIL